jgi:AcrR family transcriptional regulator
MTLPASAPASRRRRLPKGEGRQLREEILAATERMLLDTGSFEAVSIRAVADAVGVTPPSIYRHFDDKTALIFEVCTRHFGALESYIGERCKHIEDPVASLAALGKAYIEFGIANPEPYRIMFMTRPDTVPIEFQGEVLAESAAFADLMTWVQRCIDAGRFRPEYDDAYRLSLGFWARVHGMTSLLISKPGIPWPEDLTDTFLDDFLDQCLRGVVRGT